MTANENGGCPEGQTAAATDTVQGASTAYPNNNYPRPRGATPLPATCAPWCDADENGRPCVYNAGHIGPHCSIDWLGMTHEWPNETDKLFSRVEYVDARDLMTEPADMGDALALDNAVVSYRFRWYWSLGGDAA